MNNLFIIVLSIICFFNKMAYAQNTLDMYIYEQHIYDNDTLNYRILYPENYNKETKYPLIVVLHGAGERGDDNNLQLKNGGSVFIRDSIRKKYPAIVVFPQCPKKDYWSNVSFIYNNKKRFFQFNDETSLPTRSLSAVDNLISKIETTLNIDSTRMYIGGLSMGAMGTLELLWRKPNKFAAAFAFCGGTNIKASNLYSQKTGLWIFHGADDNVVPVSFSRELYENLSKQNYEVKYTEYKDVDHNCWDRAFNEPELFKWLFSHKLN